MKKIIVTQRMYKDFDTKENKDCLDVRLSEFLIEFRVSNFSMTSNSVKLIVLDFCSSFNIVSLIL